MSKLNFNVVGSFFIGLLVLGTASFVYAGNVDPATYVKTEDKYKVVEAKPVESKVSLSIDKSNYVQFSGAKFVSLNGSNINMTVSGLPLTLSTDGNTQILGVSSASNMVAGDILSGKGTINPNNGVITAMQVRDESQNSQKITDLENQIKSLMDQLKKLQAEFNSIR